jgi:hypothetical protein
LAEREHHFTVHAAALAISHRKEDLERELLCHAITERRVQLLVQATKEQSPPAQMDKRISLSTKIFNGDTVASCKRVEECKFSRPKGSLELCWDKSIKTGCWVVNKGVGEEMELDDLPVHPIFSNLGVKQAGFHKQPLSYLEHYINRFLNVVRATPPRQENESNFDQMFNEAKKEDPSVALYRWLHVIIMHASKNYNQ